MVAGFLPLIASPLQAASLGADAVVLVNSSSPNFPDFQHYLKPYLDNFGVPYTVLDVSTNSVGTDVGHYAVIIVGHSQLDTDHAFLTSTAQSNISQAVSNGTGLVNFDSALTATGGAPRYQFVQDVFAFDYGTAGTAKSVALPATQPSSQMHYITALHVAGESIALRNNMTVAGLILPLDADAIALTGGKPLMAVRKYGQGRAVQWGSYDWMAISVKGPIAGLDDLVWRSIVWVARKPFVMRGLPNFITMRVDDVAGPLDWAHVANEMKFKPWIGTFYTCMSNADIVDLQTLATNGQVTTSIHSFGCSGGQWFLWNYAGSANWPDNVMSNNCVAGKQWHVSHGIPISKVVIPHYSEIGPNAFTGLKDWGVEFTTVKNDPGTVRESPWEVLGPYRLYEPRQSGGSALPLFYADFLKVPGHPELDGLFFNCVTEIRDDAACAEWCPGNDVAASIGRGTRQVKRAFDSGALATLYTHEFYIHPIVDRHDIPAILPANWRAILIGITNTLAPYHPIFVTLDYGCQYLRATRTSRLVSSDYDTASGQVTAILTGKTDMDTALHVYLGEDNAITASFGTVPIFSGSITTTAATLLSPSLSATLSASNTLVISWPSAFAGFVVQSATNLTAPMDWITVTNTPLVLASNNIVVLPLALEQQFFRLAGPIGLAVPAGPTLDIKPSGTNVVTSWPVFFDGFQVQTATNLAAPVTWVTLTNAVQVINNRNSLTIPFSSQNGFFRLVK
ncbi:MAG: hypothetical protein JWR69_931 [Pedosphaera sp.]|nr:hypothetical protein [Pedosphaera sp.]